MKIHLKGVLFLYPDSFIQITYFLLLFDWCPVEITKDHIFVILMYSPNLPLTKWSGSKVSTTIRSELFCQVTIFIIIACLSEHLNSICLVKCIQIGLYGCFVYTYLVMKCDNGLNIHLEF